jgi:TolB-like protein
MAGEIFISYRRADQAKAGLLYQLLKDRGVDAWYDALLDAGDNWRDKTANALVAAPIFVLLFSKTAAQSDDISKELAAATFQKKTVIPVRIDNIHPEGAFLYELASRNWFDAYEDTEARLAVLADRLATLVRGKPEEAKAAVLKLGAPITAIPPQAAPVPDPKPAKPFHRNPKIIGALAGLAVAVLAGVFFLTRQPATPTPPTPPGNAAASNARIAFFGFTPDDSPQAKAIAATANDEVFRALSRQKLDAVTRSDTMAPHTNSTLDRAKELGARFVIEGYVRVNGGRLDSGFSLVDARTRTTILQRGKADDDLKAARWLPHEVSQQAVQRTNCVISYLSSYGARTPDAATLILFGQACTSDYTTAAVAPARELLKRNPEGVIEAARLAATLAWNVPASPQAMRPAMFAEANRALAVAENFGPDSYATTEARVSLAAMHDRPPIEWLPKAEASLARAPQPSESAFHARANNTVAWMMLQLGRMREADSYAQAAVDSDPTFALWQYYAPFARAAANRYNANGELFENLLNQRTAGFTWEMALTSAIFMKAFDPEIAFAAARPEVQSAVPCYRNLIASLNAKDAKTRLAGARAADVCLTAFDSPHVNIMTQSALGDLDRAFAIADRADLTSYLWQYYPPLFLPPTRAMRADPRFLRLMRKLGYFDYWKQTKTKPDVCSTPEEKGIPLCLALAPG